MDTIPATGLDHPVSHDAMASAEPEKPDPRPDAINSPPVARTKNVSGRIE